LVVLKKDLYLYQQNETIMKYLHIIANSKGSKWDERVLNSETPVKMFKSLANRNNAYYYIYELDNGFNYNKTVIVKENN